MFDCGIFLVDSRTVDYGCGDGKLSSYVEDEFFARTGRKNKHQLIGNYDRYMGLGNENGYYHEEDIIPHTFDVVISCSMLEHLIGFDEVDSFFSLVRSDGVICLHSLICEEVQLDPEWFYISPRVHCTIWTNNAMKSMSFLDVHIIWMHKCGSFLRMKANIINLNN